MTTSSRSLGSALFPVGLLLIAMASIQSGASLAKSMFPIVGAQGTTTLRLVFASIIMLLLLRPWRAKLTAKSLRTVIVYGMALGGMNFLFYMSLRTVPLGIAVALEFTGPLAVAIYASRRAVDFLWIALAIIGLLLLIPVGEASQGIDLTGAALVAARQSVDRPTRWGRVSAGHSIFCSGKKLARTTASKQPPLA